MEGNSLLAGNFRNPPPFRPNSALDDNGLRGNSLEANQGMGSGQAGNSADPTGKKREFIASTAIPLLRPLSGQYNRRLRQFLRRPHRKGHGGVGRKSGTTRQRRQATLPFSLLFGTEPNGEDIVRHLTSY